MTLSQLLIAVNNSNKIAKMIQEPELQVYIYIDGMLLENVITGGDTFANRNDFIKSIRHEYIAPMVRHIEFITQTEDLEKLHSDSTPKWWIAKCNHEELLIHRIEVIITRRN